MKFWKIFPVFVQEKGQNETLKIFLSCMNCSGLGYCISGVVGRLLED